MKDGYYWCDGCDESAYGQCCQHCHHVARWIPAPIYGYAPLTDGGDPGRKTVLRRLVSDETAHDWFSRMRAVVASA